MPIINFAEILSTKPAYVFPATAWTYVIKLKTPRMYYIGATRNLLYRMSQHLTRSDVLYVRKHGISYVPITYPCTSYEDALHLEQHLWQLYKSTKNWTPPPLGSFAAMLEIARKEKLIPRMSYFTSRVWEIK